MTKQKNKLKAMQNTTIPQGFKFSKGQVLKMHDQKHDYTYEVIVTSTKHLNCIEVQGLKVALPFQKVSLNGKAFRFDDRIIFE